MAEPRRRARLDVALERRPGAVGIANAFAVAAHREQPFERHELLAQPQNSLGHVEPCDELFGDDRLRDEIVDAGFHRFEEVAEAGADRLDRKSTRLNSSHQIISYAVFCLKKKRDSE